MFNLIIFGPPGSGKGTQSNNIREKYGFIHLSTGDLLRKEKNSGSELGLLIKSLIDDGKLVPDDIVQEMVEKFINENRDAKGFIFDGFPRTDPQAVWLDKMLSGINEKVNLMFTLDVPDEEIKNRILSRGKDSGRADDRNTEIVLNRLAVYAAQTLPVIDYYKKHDKYQSIDGMGAFDDVFKRIVALIDKSMA